LWGVRKISKPGHAAVVGELLWKTRLWQEVLQEA